MTSVATKRVYGARGVVSQNENMCKTVSCFSETRSNNLKNLLGSNVFLDETPHTFALDDNLLPMSTTDEMNEAARSLLDRGQDSELLHYPDL
jgi:hypothetical protein